MPDVTLASVIALVCLAAVFDYSNGFHDAANSIATVVSTRVLSPRFAVVWAAFFNFIAFAVFRTHVANTVGTIIDPNVVSEAVVFGGLVGAIAWNLTTWWLGLPTSSSHALIGGVVGAGMAKAGWSVVNAPSFEKTVIFIVVSPLLGMFFAFVLMLGLMWLFKGSTPRKVEHLFRRLQLLSALLVGAGYLHLGPGGKLPVPFWVVLLANSAIALGTLSGGRRIVKTLGQKITALKPIGGFSAETAAATSLYLATFLGIPVSTTHTITGAIVGAGSTRRLSAVRWGVAGRIVWAWVITIPASAITAAVAYWLVARVNHGVVLVLLTALAVAAAIIVLALRHPRSTVSPQR